MENMTTATYKEPASAETFAKLQEGYETRPDEFRFVPMMTDKENYELYEDCRLEKPGHDENTRKWNVVGNGKTIDYRRRLNGKRSGMMVKPRRNTSFKEFLSYIFPEETLPSSETDETETLSEEERHFSNVVFSEGADRIYTKTGTSDIYSWQYPSDRKRVRRLRRKRGNYIDHDIDDHRGKPPEYSRPQLIKMHKNELKRRELAKMAHFS